MSTDSARIDVGNGCISYLLQRFDRNLFITCEPLSAVRKLKNDLMSCNDIIKRCREEHNPHLISGSILMLLRELNQCLMHEIYQDIVKADVKEDVRLLKLQIRQFIVKSSPTNFELIKKLFLLLNKASTSCDIPLAGQHIGESISPILCFLPDSAYFSIRHKEHLITIQPVIVCMINYYHDIFTNELRPVPLFTSAKIAQAEKDTSKVGGIYKNKTNGILTVPNSDNLFNTNHQSKLLDNNIVDPTTNLHMAISSSNCSSNTFEINGSTSSSTSSISSQSLSSKTPDLTGWQWKIVESLVLGCVASSMKLELSETRKIIEESHVLSSNKPKRTAQSLGSSDTSKSRYARTNKDSCYDNVSEPKGGNTNDSQDHSFVKRSQSTRRINFKRLLSDFKVKRNQILAFEEEFTKINNRTPRQGDRGPIEAIYTQYSVLKRKIRDYAATEIERVVRGYLTRKIISSIASKVSINNHQNGHHTIPNNFSNSNGKTPPVLTLNELYAMYRDIRSQKHELKRRLKQFDVDFEAKHRRVPEKSDKEVVRPLYQKYQALKAQLDDLQKVIETSHGRVPDDLLDRDLPEGVDMKNQQHQSRATMSIVAPLNLGISYENIENKIVTNTDEKIIRYDLNKPILPSSSGNLSLPVQMNIGNISSPSNTGISITIEQLQQEKTNLWTYLKAYEKDFTRRNGRQVTSTADITPVVREYQRYKEIKLQLITLQGASNVN